MLTKEQLPRTCSRIGFKRGILMTLTKLCLTMKRMWFWCHLPQQRGATKLFQKGA